MSSAPRVQVARLIEHRLPDGSVLFSGAHAGIRWRLEPTGGRVSKGDSRRVWRLLVENAVPPKATAKRKASVGRPRRQRGPASGEVRAPSKAQQADMQAETLMRSIGVDPSKPMPADALPW